MEHWCICCEEFMFSSVWHGFHLSFQIHSRRWTGYYTLPIGVSARVCVCVFHSYTKGKQDRSWSTATHTKMFKFLSKVFEHYLGLFSGFTLNILTDFWLALFCVERIC